MPWASPIWIAAMYNMGLSLKIARKLQLVQDVAAYMVMGDGGGPGLAHVTP